MSFNREVGTRDQKGKRLVHLGGKLRAQWSQHLPLDPEVAWEDQREGTE